MGIGVPPRNISRYTGFQRWLHQLWLDISSARFWKGAAHHLLRGIYDAAATGIAFALLVFAFIGPAAAIAIRQSDDDAGLSFLSPPLAFVLAVHCAARRGRRFWFSRPLSTPPSIGGCCRRPRRRH